MPTKDFDPTQLQHWTVESDYISAIHACIREPEYTYSYATEYEEVQELTFRQKLALEWIIFKTWIKRVFGRVRY